MTPASICVIVPTRGRPQAVRELADAWRETEAEAMLLFVVDTDDPFMAEYKNAHDALPYADNVEMVFGPRLRLAGSLNVAAVQAAQTFDVVGFLGDDHRPRTKGWSGRIAECLSGGSGIVYGNDLLMGERMPTAVFMTSDIVSQLGYMCPPGFVHLCLDLVWLDWGRGMNRITYLADVVIEHMHPANGKAPLDAGYAEVNSQEQVHADTTAYFRYRDEGGLEADLIKLKELL